MSWSGQNWFAWKKWSGWWASAWPPQASCHDSASGSPRSLGMSVPRWRTSGQCMTTESRQAPATIAASSRPVISRRGAVGIRGMLAGMPTRRTHDVPGRRPI